MEKTLVKGENPMFMRPQMSLDRDSGDNYVVGRWSMVINVSPLFPFGRIAALNLCKLHVPRSVEIDD